MVWEAVDGAALDRVDDPFVVLLRKRRLQGPSEMDRLEPPSGCARAGFALCALEVSKLGMADACGTIVRRQRRANLAGPVRLLATPDPTHNLCGRLARG